jgi:4-hydroxy-tetrahydrodipicolinate synthase
MMTPDTSIPDGIHTPVVTPYAADGSIDHACLAGLVESLLGSGINAIVPGGTTGEYYAHTLDERVSILETVATTVGQQAALIAGANTLRPDDTIGLALRAKSLGYGALMLQAPPYSLPSADDLVEHFRRVAGEVGLPIMLYNYPARTGVDMDLEFLNKALEEIPEIVAIKESTGSITRLHNLAFEFGDRIRTVCGMDDQALEFFLWGATAFVAGASNFLPQQHVRLYEMCVVAQDFVTGRELMCQLMPMFTLLEQGGKYIQYCKYGTELRGCGLSAVRPPITDLTARERAHFGELFNAVRHGSADDFADPRPNQPRSTDDDTDAPVRVG